MKKGNLILISGPSGVGKGSVIKGLIKQDNNFVLSISVTTRQQREYETDGIEYFFISDDEFQQMIEKDELLEWAEYAENKYGTPKKMIFEQLEKGRNVILEIEVQGALQVMAKTDNLISIFILPPDLDTLRNRLTKRGTEDNDKLEKRLRVVEFELSKKEVFKYRVVNETGQLDKTIENILEIIRKDAL
ncbi:MAG: guanylate kinase [Candidatus Dojkabacteria bacterium]|nr:guanylate kinase [Candidatus Dojkabacteria bacterium]MDQ7021235.1 guanylate kinase [Candidatus Dojkabacteria bacterium]